MQGLSSLLHLNKQPRLIRARRKFWWGLQNLFCLRSLSHFQHSWLYPSWALSQQCASNPLRRRHLTVCWLNTSSLSPPRQRFTFYMWPWSSCFTSTGSAHCGWGVPPRPWLCILSHSVQPVNNSHGWMGGAVLFGGLMQKAATTETCQCALSFLMGMGSVGDPVRENAEYRLFPHGICISTCISQ